MTTLAPRMAAADALETQPASAQTTMGFHSLQEVLGASGGETATRAGPAHKVEDGREEKLIATDEDANQPFHGWVGVFKISARLASRSQSFSSSAKSASGDLHRAMRTRWQPSTMRSW